MGRQGRLEYLRRIYGRYQGASREAKGKILDEFCQVAGYHRKYAVRLLNGSPPGKRPRRRRATRRVYGDELVRVLREVWEVAGHPWSVRLKALLPTWLPWVHRHYRLSRALEEQLLAISARQIDRLLAPHRSRLKKRLYGRTKPGTLLKHQIPLRTDRWRTTGPGFTEIDLVSHSGERADGEFIHALNLTDIHTTWVETRAVMGKGKQRVRDALEEMRLTLPFRLQGIDSDNGSEFVNDHLLAYCQAQGIQFTRGRPYKKDDNAHIEQKNWTHVRKLMGYVRYDTPKALAAMNRLYEGDLRLFQNLFLPSVKLVRKVRVGSRTRRIYDAPQTPFERVLACPEPDPVQVRRLKALQKRLDPFELSRSIDQQLELIHRLATTGRRPARRPTPPAPDHPWKRFRSVAPREARVTSSVARRSR